MKYFIITVDTEGDNLWNWNEGEKITTQNVKAIPKFQALCERFEFKPVYLINYEMAMNDELVEYLKEKAKKNLCEIGIHIHAWNTPPVYKLEGKYNGNPYITEYPKEIMLEKVTFLKNLIEDRFDTKVISHRSGRWATNEEYFKVLKEVGIKIDCSVTPEINMSMLAGRSCKKGPNYTHFQKNTYSICDGIIEVPMSTRKVRRLVNGSLQHKIKCLLLGDALWMRILSENITDVKYLKNKIEKENKCNYIEFMLHSSELMPGGSPYFPSDKDVDQLFESLKRVFKDFSQNGYTGVTLKQYIKLTENIDRIYTP
ncbi:polysaccharide deacetylase family protein [Dorea formicigenerans]|uniref:hypothetical protein n=1 Tax=Dorea formicigenerans TaxID=39486 RepID=UPI0036F1CEAB